MKIAVCDDEIQFVNVTCEMLKEYRLRSAASPMGMI